MNFHEVQFPAAISFGSSGGVERRTEIVTLVNGYEERNSPWAHSRRRFDAGLGVRSMDDLSEVLTFFEARHGQLFGFRWKDWLDHRSCAPSASVSATDQVLEGSGTTWQLVKRYEDAAGSYVREITKPKVGTIVVAVGGAPLTEGTEFTVDVNSGVVTLASNPGSGPVTAGFEFDVPVRFDVDRIEVNLAAFEAGDIPSVPVIEVRV